MNVKVSATVGPDGATTVDVECDGRSATVIFTADKIEFSVPEETG